MWHRNISEHFDTLGATNLGYTKQKALAVESKEFDMMEKLHLDLFFQNRYLLKGVEMRLRLIRSKDLFCLHGNANQAQNKVSLKEVTLFFLKVKLNPAIQLARVKALQHVIAKYPLRRMAVKSFTVTGNRSITKQNLFLGQLPTGMVVGVVNNDAYNVVITKSPFNFKHNNINFMTIYRDGVQIPSKPLQPDFTDDRFIRSYVRLFTQTGQYYRDTENAISREQYKDGCALLVFDLTLQMNSSEVGFELIKHGNIRIEIDFATDTAHTLTVIVFAEHDNLLEIDQDKNVDFDYTACYGKYSLSFEPAFISAFDLLNFCLTFNLIHFIISRRSLAN